MFITGHDDLKGQYASAKVASVWATVSKTHDTFVLAEACHIQKISDALEIFTEFAFESISILYLYGWNDKDCNIVINDKTLSTSNFRYSLKIILDPFYRQT